MKKTADWDYEKEIDDLEDKNKVQDLANGMSVEDAIGIFKESYTVETWTFQKMDEVNAAKLKLITEGHPLPSYGVFNTKHDDELNEKEAKTRIKGYLIMKKVNRANVLLKKFGYPTVKVN